MHWFFGGKVAKTSFVTFAVKMWVCCVLVISGILFVFFGWQVAAVLIAALSALILVLAWGSREPVTTAP